MNAEEIRRKKNWECYGQPYESPIQAEIAAQLAEANELKRLEVEALNNLGSAVNLLTHEGSPLGKLAGSAESIAVSLDILVNRGGQ